MQGGDGKEYGPVSAEQLRQWASEGRANSHTMVRLAEGGTFVPFGSVAELAGFAPMTGTAADAASTPLSSASNNAASAAAAGDTANYFMQGGDGKEYGPVNVAQLRQWINEGRANAQTRVRPAEGGAFVALGSLPGMFSTASAVGGSAKTSGLPLAHALAQQSGSAGSDSALLIKRLAVILAASSGWMKFLAGLMILGGVATAIGPMIVVAWLPIWLGIVLWGAASKAQDAAVSGTEADMIKALDQLRFYFKLEGIMRIVMFVAVAVIVICFIGMIVAAIGSAGNMRNF